MPPTLTQHGNRGERIFIVLTGICFDRPDNVEHDSGNAQACDQKPQYGKHRKEQHKWFAGLALRPYDEGYYHQQNQQQE